MFSSFRDVEAIQSFCISILIFSLFCFAFVILRLHFFHCLFVGKSVPLMRINTSGKVFFRSCWSILTDQTGLFFFSLSFSSIFYSENDIVSHNKMCQQANKRHAYAFAHTNRCAKYLPCDRRIVNNIYAHFVAVEFIYLFLFFFFFILSTYRFSLLVVFISFVLILASSVE